MPTLTNPLPAATLGNLCFLSRLVAVRGLEGAVSVYTAGLDAISDAGDESEAAQLSHQRLLLHRALLCRLRRCRGPLTGEQKKNI
jgi:hypothetical protein